MNDNAPEQVKSGRSTPGKQAERRAPRSIRFSDAEWAGIEEEARSRGMTAAELVRHAATSAASGKTAMDCAPFPADIAAQVERIYRGVYLLSTLKRDEMVGGGAAGRPRTDRQRCARVTGCDPQVVRCPRSRRLSGAQ